ncbi:uncharacterized protein LOC107367441 [Tetranychus urticae]|uniref:Reelin domain-containing protein n=1 Tax=Tetranychus urticae TaxID=32264 RepID=T1KV21_TETUR|nr:uncharacterized protein LOC107367441 [Tetranychus urticae]
MNSKTLFAFVLVNICIITVTAQVYNYGVTVRTASKKFDSHDGKLKLSITSPNSDNSKKNTAQEFVLTPNDIKIKREKIYTATISSIAPLQNITSVYLRWTLASPYNPYYAINKPKIYFDSVTLSTATLNPYTHLASSESRKFCPTTIPIGIKHADGATFNSCF